MRDTWVLVREFRGALILFGITLLTGAASFQALWNLCYADGEPLRFIEALYDVLSMIFFQPVLDFPEAWYLDLYFFVMPILGLIVLARGMADFFTLLFNRRSRLAQWEEAVASTYNDHIIVCGLGHLGIRVVRELIGLREDIVVIELQADCPRFDEVRGYDIPIIVGDARAAEVLDRAGIERAEAIVICTNNDLINLQIASCIRERDKDVRLVMRMFDDQFARSIADHFDISAVMSASMMAAPAFAGAATGAEIIQTFRVADRVLAMGRLVIRAGSRLDGSVVSEVEEQLDIPIVLHQSGSAIDVQPHSDVILRAGDIIAVVAEAPAIKTLASHWNYPPKGR